MQSSTLLSLSLDKRNNFDFLRLLLAVLVIFFHGFVLLKYSMREPMEAFTHQQTNFGEFAVNGFYVISGFLVTASWLRSEGFKDYLKKRVLRIYPGFVVVCLFCGLIVGPLGAESQSAYFHQLSFWKLLLTTFTLGRPHVPMTFGNSGVPGEVNGSLWSIRIEFECYLVAALLGALTFLKKRSVPLGLLAACVVLNGYCMYHLSSAGLSHMIKFHTESLTYFLSGMVFYLYRDVIPHSYRLLLLSLAAIFLTSVTTGLHNILPIAESYLLVYVAFCPGVKLSGFGRRADLSYGVYLYGWPVQQLMVLHFGRELNPYLLFAAALLFACPLAALSWFAIESPMLRLKRRRPIPAAQPALITSPT